VGQGTRYLHIEKILRQHYQGGRALELGAGGAVYRDIFNDYIGSDLYSTKYQSQGDLGVYCDARQLPFKDESIDFSFQVASLYMIENPEKVLQETRRVLRPGGKFLVFDYTISTKKNLVKAHEKNNDNVHINFWTRSDLLLLFTENGYRNAIPLETKPYWGLITALCPGVADYGRSWLMVAGEK